MHHRILAATLERTMGAWRRGRWRMQWTRSKRAATIIAAENAVARHPPPRVLSSAPWHAKLMSSLGESIDLTWRIASPELVETNPLGPSRPSPNAPLSEPGPLAVSMSVVGRNSPVSAPTPVGYDWMVSSSRRPAYLLGFLREPPSLSLGSLGRPQELIRQMHFEQQHISTTSDHLRCIFRPVPAALGRRIKASCRPTFQRLLNSDQHTHHVHFSYLSLIFINCFLPSLELGIFFSSIFYSISFFKSLFVFRNSTRLPF